MADELGKIEKPSIEEFRGGKKLFFIPMVISSKELPLEYVIKVDHYWDEVEAHIANLEAKLGPVSSMFHELIPESGEKGLNEIKEMNIGSYNIIQSRLAKEAKLESVEDKDILTELMDWSRCLSSGLQNEKVFSKIHQFYLEANEKRNQYITKKLNDTLKDNDIGILVMAEGHHIQFPQDIRIFYVSPPSLDEIKRWLRDYEAKTKEKLPEESQKSEL